MHSLTGVQSGLLQSTFTDSDFLGPSVLVPAAGLNLNNLQHVLVIFIHTDIATTISGP